MQPGQMVRRGVSRSGRAVTLRIMGPHDARAMRDFLNAISIEHTFITWQGEIISLLEEEAFLLAELRRFDEHESVRVLAWVGRDLVGIANVTLRTRVERHVGDLGISIARDYRADGIGRLLLDQTLDLAAEWLTELEVVALSVFGNNEVAIRLYQQMGFVEYGRLVNGVRHLGQLVDNVLMARPVDRAQR